MSWFDEEILNASGSSWYDKTLVDNDAAQFGTEDAPVGQSDFYGDILESFSVAFGDSMPEWIASDEDFSRALERFKESGVDTTIKNEPPKTVESSRPTADKSNDPGAAKGGGLIGRASAWIDQNKGLVEILGKGIQAAAAGRQAKENAKASARSRVEELQEADRLKQAESARISASITGLRRPPPISVPAGGLIALAKKRTLNGQPVFKG